MAGAYAKEFEKWLQGDSKGQNEPTERFNDEDSVDMDDSNDEVDTYETSTPLKNSAQLTSKLPSGNSLNSDEPPILEPVRCGQTKISDAVAISNSSSKAFENVANCITLVDSDNKEAGVKSKDESEKCFYGKVDKPENIFDKFSLLSETDDFPPPLIPSHEAHLTTVDAKDDDSFTEKSYATLQNLSPNFCAMEADSTSEMMKGIENVCKDRAGGKSAPVSGDTSMECDSTCMLSVSPHVVSPGSNIESDNPHTPYSVDVSTDGNPSMTWNTFSSRGTYTSLMPFSEQTHLDYSNRFLSTDGVNNRGVYHHELGDWDRECPKLEAVRDVAERDNHLPPMLSVVGEDLHEPPILSVVPPPSLMSPRMAARRKRHTIDTVDSVSRKHKAYSKDSSSNKGVHTGPSSSRSNKDLVKKKGERKSSVSKRRDCSISKNEPGPPKQRERSKTLPIVDLISFGSHLPKDLYDFVVTSSQLSLLQNRMHRLVYLLFPQLASEIELMSPESSQFETLLKDLIHSLKEPHAGSKSNNEVTHEMKCSDDDDICRSDSNWNSVKPDIKCDDKPSDGQCLESVPKEDSQCSRVIKDSSCCSKYLIQHSSPRVFSNSSLPHTVNPDIGINAKGHSVIPTFSQLSLNEESQRILKNQPSVLIHKDPSSLHKNFCKLSCRTLELLLPDLNVSLLKVFSDSPKDLLHFIDSVIASNTHAE